MGVKRYRISDDKVQERLLVWNTPWNMRFWLPLKLPSGCHWNGQGDMVRLKNSTWPTVVEKSGYVSGIARSTHGGMVFKGRVPSNPVHSSIDVFCGSCISLGTHERCYSSMPWPCVLKDSCTVRLRNDSLQVFSIVNVFLVDCQFPVKSKACLGWNSRCAGAVKRTAFKDISLCRKHERLHHGQGRGRGRGQALLPRTLSWSRYCSHRSKSGWWLNCVDVTRNQNPTHVQASERELCT